MTSSTKHPFSRVLGVLAAAAAAIVLAFAAALVDEASATGGYTTSTYNGCPSTKPYYKVSYTGYRTCSAYP